MSRTARIGLLVGTVAILVLAFVVFSPSDDETGTATTPAADALTTTDGQTTPAKPPPAPSAAQFEQITIKNSTPVGGVRTITLKHGERARIEVSSPDTSDEIHLHGYDLVRDLRAGGSVKFSFTADAEGIFELELEGAGLSIGKLVVEP